MTLKQGDLGKESKNGKLLINLLNIEVSVIYTTVIYCFKKYPTDAIKTKSV